MLRIERVVGDLPAGFDRMRTEASVEGYRFLKRLSGQWNAETACFEALLAAYMDEDLAGIGGLTPDPVVADALRMRRFYVRVAFRRQGIGRKLVEVLLAHCGGRIVTVNAGRGSEAFWEALGFIPDPCDSHTHLLRA